MGNPVTQTQHGLIILAVCCGGLVVAALLSRRLVEPGAQVNLGFWRWLGRSAGQSIAALARNRWLWTTVSASLALSVAWRCVQIWQDYVRWKGRISPWWPSWPPRWQDALSYIQSVHVTLPYTGASAILILLSFLLLAPMIGRWMRSGSGLSPGRATGWHIALIVSALIGLWYTAYVMLMPYAYTQKPLPGWYSFSVKAYPLMAAGRLPITALMYGLLLALALKSLRREAMSLKEAARQTLGNMGALLAYTVVAAMPLGLIWGLIVRAVPGKPPAFMSWVQTVLWRVDGVLLILTALVPVIIMSEGCGFWEAVLRFGRFVRRSVWRYLAFVVVGATLLGVIDWVIPRPGPQSYASAWAYVVLVGTHDAAKFLAGLLLTVLCCAFYAGAARATEPAARTSAAGWRRWAAWSAVGVVVLAAAAAVWVYLDAPAPRVVAQMTEERGGTSQLLADLEGRTSSQAYGRLLNGSEGMVLTRRQPTDAEAAEARRKCGGFEVRAVAVDALAFFVNERNPVSELTSAQIAGIYSGAVSNWSEVGGAKGKIRVCQAAEGSDERAWLAGCLWPGTAKAPQLSGDASRTLEGMVEAVRRDVNAIGYAAFSLRNRAQLNGVRVLRVDEARPDRSAVINGTYPLRVRIYAAIQGTAAGDVRARRDKLLTRSGQVDLGRSAGCIAIDDFAPVDPSNTGSVESAWRSYRLPKDLFPNTDFAPALGPLLSTLAGRLSADQGWSGSTPKSGDGHYAELLPTGSGAAYERLTRGLTEMALADRPPLERETRLAGRNGVRFDARPLAKVALVFLVNENNAVTGLSRDQARDIWTGRVTSWKALGGPDRPIVLRRVDAASAVEGVLQDYVAGSRPASAADAVMPRSTAPFDWVASDEDSLACAFQMGDKAAERRGARVLAVDGVRPTAETLADGRYPYTLDCRVVVREDAPEKARRVRDWMLSPSRAEAFAAAGVVPAQRSAATPAAEMDASSACGAARVTLKMTDVPVRDIIARVAQLSGNYLAPAVALGRDNGSTPCSIDVKDEPFWKVMTQLQETAFFSLRTGSGSNSGMAVEWPYTAGWGGPPRNYAILYPGPARLALESVSIARDAEGAATTLRLMCDVEPRFYVVHGAMRLTEVVDSTGTDLLAPARGQGGLPAASLNGYNGMISPRTLQSIRVPVPRRDATHLKTIKGVLAFNVVSPADCLRVDVSKPGGVLRLHDATLTLVEVDTSTKGRCKLTFQASEGARDLEYARMLDGTVQLVSAQGGAYTPSLRGFELSPPKKVDLLDMDDEPKAAAPQVATEARPRVPNMTLTFTGMANETPSVLILRATGTKRDVEFPFEWHDIPLPDLSGVYVSATPPPDVPVPDKPVAPTPEGIIDIADLKPSRFTIKAENMSLADFMAEVARQTGNVAKAPGSPKGWRSPTPSTLTRTFDNVEFWKGMDEARSLCRLAEYPVPFRDGGTEYSLQLMTGWSGHREEDEHVTSYVGPLRIRVSRADVKVVGGGATTSNPRGAPKLSLCLNASVLIEPHMAVLRHGLSVEECIGSNGKDYVDRSHPFNRRQSYDAWCTDPRAVCRLWTGSDRQAYVEFAEALSGGDAPRRIARLRLYYVAQIMEKESFFEVTDPLTAGSQMLANGLLLQWENGLDSMKRKAVIFRMQRADGLSLEEARFLASAKSLARTSEERNVIDLTGDVNPREKTVRWVCPVYSQKERFFVRNSGELRTYAGFIDFKDIPVSLPPPIE